MKKFSESISKLSLNNAKNALKSLDEKSAIHVLDMEIRNNPPIKIHDNTRKQRDNFYKNLNEYCVESGFNDLANFISEKINTISLAENLFDKIKVRLKQCEVEKLPEKEQCWAHIARAEFDAIQIFKEIDKKIIQSNGVMSSTFLIEDENTNKYSPDKALGLIVNSLTLSLKMLCHRNNWIHDSLFVCPSKISTDSQAVETQYLAWVWHNLKDSIYRTLKFGGSLRKMTIEEIATLKIPDAIKNQEFFYFDRQITYDEVFDVIANHRLTNKFFQNSCEIFSKPKVVKYINEIKKINDKNYLVADEFFAIVQIGEILNMNIYEDKNLYHELSLVEWVRIYALLKFIAKESYAVNHDSLIISEKNILELFKKSAINKDRIDKAIKYLTFNMKSRDLFDTPLIKLDNKSYYIFKHTLLSMNITNVVFSKLSTLGTRFNNKGKYFEKTVIKFIKSKGFKCEAFKFNKDGDEFEFDAIFIMNDKVFIVECKNTSLSYNDVTQAYRFSHFILESIKQVNRLTDGLKKYPDVFKEKFGVNLNEYEIIPLVMNCLPYSTNQIIENVYVTDFSSFSKFFSDKFVNRVAYGNNNVEKIPKYQLWAGDKPTANEFIDYLKNPIQIKMLLDSIKSRLQSHSVDNDTMFIINSIDIQCEPIINEQ